MSLVASGIPFGLGIFSLFVCGDPTSNTVYPKLTHDAQLSTITYLVDTYRAGAAASG